MKKSYRMFKRKNGYYYIQNNSTGDQRSLGTANKEEAQRLFQAENEARRTPNLNMQLGKVYLSHADPELATRTWQTAINELSSHGKESSQTRCARAMRSPAFDLIRNKPIAWTTGEDLKAVLKRGGSATNNYLRRLHNLALGNGWIQWHIIPTKQWEKPAKNPRRAITLEEHQRIIAAEQNIQRRHYYEMLWLTGAAQTDGALLRAENVDWDRGVLSFQRMKTGEWSHQRIGPALGKLLKSLPSEGSLFPHISKLEANDRSAEFYRRCRLMKIEGISLHSYRYAWAERAYKLGYAERFAQAALGHKSRAVHHAYAKNAEVVCPALDEDNKIISLRNVIEAEEKGSASK